MYQRTKNCMSSIGHKIDRVFEGNNDHDTSKQDEDRVVEESGTQLDPKLVEETPIFEDINGISSGKNQRIGMTWKMRNCITITSRCLTRWIQVQECCKHQ